MQTSQGFTKPLHQRIGELNAMLALLPAFPEDDAAVDNLIELESASSLATYREALASHDWSYEFRECPVARADGQAEADLIRDLGHFVDPERRIFNEYAPAHRRVGGKPVAGYWSHS